jgi:hypothetical protein
MGKRVFFSLHYEVDHARASQIRNIGVVEGNRPVSPNDWKAIKSGGDTAIRRWIDGQLQGCCCTIVLIGRYTAGRRWVRYEIEKSWRDGKGVFGIYIHRLKDFQGEYAVKGKNPFDDIMVPALVFGRSLARTVKAYAPPHRDSKKVYRYIGRNMSDWIDEAISIREYGPLVTHGRVLVKALLR